MYGINSLDLKFQPLQNFIANIVKNFLIFLDYEAKVEGENIIVIHKNILMQFEISFDSTGWKGLFLISALVFSTPAIKLKRKMKVLSLFLPIVFLINLIRIISTILIGINFGFESFRFWHIFLWSYGFLLIIFIFWASWCAPCRKESPNLVAAYKCFRNTEFRNGNGFTIFSISLDKNALAWKKAIKDDGLIWPYHVSDLRGWKNEAAKLYHVRSVPSNFLIDGDGIIVGVNLRGPALEAKLKKLKKKNFWFW